MFSPLFIFQKQDTQKGVTQIPTTYDKLIKKREKSILCKKKSIITSPGVKTILCHLEIVFPKLLKYLWEYKHTRRMLDPFPHTH